MVNALWSALLNDEEDGSLFELLKNLQYYTESHFSAEEALMELADYPHLDAHRQEHHRFETQISEALFQHVEGHPFSLDLLRFLNDWLINHIKGRDRDYAAYIEERHTSIWTKGLRRIKNLFGRKALEERPGDVMDLEQAIEAHMLWRRAVEQHLLGSDAPGIDLTTIALTDACLLGNWIKAQHGSSLQRLDEFAELIKSHDLFHQCAGRVVALSQGRRLDEARQLARTELRHTSNQVRMNIIKLYGAVKRESLHDLP